MKKTLTVNLGGTVFHIDEDAYRLLDDYLCNLKLHFRKQKGAEEIVDDIENRISELLTEKVQAGAQVITITDIEEVIARVGKPEELLEEETEEKTTGSSSNAGADSANKESSGTHRRLFRNPDDKILGGVIGGIAASLGWSATTLRLILLVLLICGVGTTLIPVYIVCWIVIPEARTAADRLHMRGEEVTVENIGKTVTDGFEKVANGVNNYMRSEKPRTFIEKLGDALVTIVGFVLKACLAILILVFSPVLFILAVVFVALVIGAISIAIGGGALFYHMLPAVNWAMVSVSPLAMIVASIGGVILVGIPLASMLYAVLRLIFNWQPMASGLKITLLILWIAGLLAFVLCFSQMHWQIPFLNNSWYYTSCW
ncbi:PspC domain-containing protein [uncultured Bacteroides sp.]|uniref:PspC domain-containing protein n=1 Tax=uncultured Bacteroides sp. TaxID=162156 RepID=UPI002AA872A8|nr:PspC domain-containing protein [uncultured Bacteroides sp.]